MEKILITLAFIFAFNSYADDDGTRNNFLENKSEETKEAPKVARAKFAWKLPTFFSMPDLPRPPAPIVPEDQSAEVKVELLTTKESKLNIVEKVSEDDKFIMFQIARTDEPEKVETLLYPVDNGEVRAQLYFRKGAGRYVVNILTNKTNEKYSLKAIYSWVKRYDVENYDTRDMDFLLPSIGVQSDNKTLVKLAKKITREAVNEADAVKRIHDFIVGDLDYDTASYNDQSYLTKPYDAMTVFKTKRAVCLGYSNYLAALARAIGIRARVVFGQAMISGSWQSHAWNEVNVNGEWKIIDSTWDDPIKYTYFFPTEQQFSVDHRKETNNPEI